MSSPENFQPHSLDGYIDLEQAAQQNGDLVQDAFDEHFQNQGDFADLKIGEDPLMWARYVDILTKTYFGNECENEARATTFRATMFAAVLSHYLSESGELGVSLDHIGENAADEEAATAYVHHAPGQYLVNRPNLDGLIHKYMPHICPDEQYVHEAELIVCLNLMNMEEYLIRQHAEREADHFAAQLEDWDGTFPPLDGETK